MEEKPRLEQIASCYAGGPALVTGIGLQSFSLTLALRYLNPKRTYFSLITLVCLLGVAVGVMVLIVVLAVMAGFEREVKSRLLGFSPHIELRKEGVIVTTGDGGMVTGTLAGRSPSGISLRLEPGLEDPIAIPSEDIVSLARTPLLIREWGNLQARVEGIAEVTESYAQLRDFTILEKSDRFAPIEFRAIDTSNEEQMAALGELILDGGTADVGLDERAVVAESTAKNFDISVGDKILLHSARNLQQMANSWKITDRQLVAEEHASLFDQARRDLAQEMVSKEDKEVFDWEFLAGLYDAIDGLRDGKIRPSEQEILTTVLIILQEGTRDEESSTFALEAGSLQRILEQLDLLAQMDREVEDGRLLRGLREVALPRELEVVGIFRTSQHVMHPAVFVPLATGQELKNMEGGVESLGVRVTDPYQLEEVKARLEQELGPSWSVRSWQDQNRAWVELIARERMMMYFALSFIVLVSAFCIMAVIFTITIMKKQEIGVMKALGATPFQVIRVFTFQGSIVGLMGALLGVGLGLLVVRFRDPIYQTLKRVGFDVFPAEFHGIDGLPAHVNMQEVATVGIGASILCVIAALIPAFLTSRRDPARCLRNY